MKKITITFLIAALCTTAFAQKDNYIRPTTIGLHFFFEDFQTPQDLVHNSLHDVLKENNWSNGHLLIPGIGADFMKGITKNIDFAAALSASYVMYPTSDATVYAAPTNISPSKSLTQNNLFDLTASLNFKLLSDKHMFTPYLTGGIGGSLYQSEVGVFAPVGLGVQANIKRSVYFFLASQYRIHITDNTADHLYHSLGIAGSIDHKRVHASRPLPSVALDTDGDGVVDSLDRCPTAAGPASLKGCPDKDGDGIPDIDDKCPDVAGVAKYAGCPVPDRDKDGIADEDDKCPDVAGVAKYAGCPIPDTDGDGVNDEVDKCPTVKGVASNFGCPVISKAVVDKINAAAKNIFFATGSDKLLPASYKSLNEIASILTTDPSLKVSIDGYTDNTGNADKNVALSQKRADAVKAFLNSKKINENRLTATGHGSDKPLADNATAEGRAKNRRVEMKASSF